MTEKRGLLRFFKGFGGPDKNPSEVADIHTEILDDEADEPNTLSPEMIEFCKNKLTEILNMSGFPSTVATKPEGGNTVLLTIDCQEDTGRIIGKEGATIESFQVLLRAMAVKQFGTAIRVLVDAGDYRKRKFESLRAKVMRIAKTVRNTNQKEELRPMAASERRAIHMIFKNDRDVRSYSVGEGRNRRVVLEKRNG